MCGRACGPMLGGYNGGGNPGPGPDCGTRTVKPWLLDLSYYRRDHIQLQAEETYGGDPFERCSHGGFPYLLSGKSFGKRQSAELPVREVFDNKIGKLITIGAGSESLPYPEGYDETMIRWELSLTRIKGK